MGPGARTPELAVPMDAAGWGAKPSPERYYFETFPRRHFPRQGTLREQFAPCSSSGALALVRQRLSAFA